jgi:hypothetical protein
LDGSRSGISGFRKASDSAFHNVMKKPHLVIGHAPTKIELKRGDVVLVPANTGTFERRNVASGDAGFEAPLAVDIFDTPKVAIFLRRAEDRF